MLVPDGYFEYRLQLYLRTRDSDETLRNHLATTGDHICSIEYCSIMALVEQASYNDPLFTEDSVRGGIYDLLNS